MTTASRIVAVADASAIVALFQGDSLMRQIYGHAEREQVMLVFPALAAAVASAAAGAGASAWEAVLLPPGVHEVPLTVASGIELAGQGLADNPHGTTADQAQIWQTAWEARQLGAGARIITTEAARYKGVPNPGVVSLTR